MSLPTPWPLASAAAYGIIDEYVGRALKGSITPTGSHGVTPWMAFEAAAAVGSMAVAHVSPGAKQLAAGSGVGAAALFGRHLGSLIGAHSL